MPATPWDMLVLLTQPTPERADMKQILFTCDLTNEAAATKKTGLEEAIKTTFPTRWHQRPSTWAVETSMSAADVNIWLVQHLGPHVEVFVADVSEQDVTWSGMDGTSVRRLEGVFKR